ncbi:hypothetical protein MLD38_028280 [Melastoma candidum]|uniref:Uncharacterized protein n=1 Tax=Melastoma candidum TaxID=119954 RepID=A0ACB9N2X4_9MYRT|nr:hypothetical protein MLD38_028280 [Melastoma candidum]
MNLEAPAPGGQAAANQSTFDSHAQAPALGGQAAINQSAFDSHAPSEFISRLEFHKELGNVRQELTDMKSILIDVQTLIGRLSSPRDEERMRPRSGGTISVQPDKVDSTSSAGPSRRCTPDLREAITQVIEQVVPGIARRDDACLYRSPYPAYVDRDFPLPRGYKVPDFTRFSGEDEMTPLEHVTRFTHQLGEAAGNDFWKLKLFPNSLTGDAFTWYASLPPGSVASWTQMQSMFVKTFARLDTPMSMFEVMRLKQDNGEHPRQFLMKLRKALLRCRPPIPEKDQLLLALNELSIPFQKKLQGERFADLYDLARRATEYYQLLTEEAKLTRAYQVDTYEVDVAEFVKGESTTCDPLTKKNSKAKASQKNAEERKYSFDTDKVSPSKEKD